MKKYRDVLRLPFSAIAGEKKQVLLVLAGLLATVLIQFRMPFLTQRLVDDGLTRKDLQLVFVLSALMLLLYALQSLIQVRNEAHRVVIYSHVYESLQKKAVSHLLKLNMGYFSSHSPSEVFTALSTDIRTISSMVSGDVFESLAGAVSAIAGVAALFRISRRLCIAMLSFLPVMILTNRILSKRNESVVSGLNESSADYSGRFADALEGVFEIRSLGLQEEFSGRLSSQLDNVLSQQAQQNILMKRYISMQQLLSQALMSGLYILGGALLTKDSITLGTIAAFEGYSVMVLYPLMDGLELLFSVSGLVPSLKRFGEFLSCEEEPDGGESAPCAGEIRLEDVSFSYAGREDPVIDHLSMTVPAGSKTALTGRNGAGKTTLLNLIQKAAVPSSGRILLDGADIRSCGTETYRELFSVVPQKPFFFNDSILYNVTFGRKVCRQRLDELVRMLNMQDLISSHGWTFRVGVGGSRLSGGEKQKIALCRALLLDRPVVILDEASSGIDRETCEVLRQSFSGILREKTVICVTHSAETMGLFDQVIRLH